MSCTLNSTKVWLKSHGYLKEDGRKLIGGRNRINEANSKLKTLAIKKYGSLPEMMERNSIVSATKNNTLRIYKPFFEWMDKQNKSNNFFNTKEEESTEINKKEVEELSKQFYPLLHKLGISIDVVKSLEEKYNVDALGVADIVNKTIALKDGEAGIETLSEEISHFAIESLDQNNTLLKRALELVVDTQEYKDNKDEYMKIYKSERKVKKEVLGKLLKDELVKEQSFQKKSSLARVLHRIWDKFMSLFTSNELKKFVRVHAKDIVNNNLENFKRENLTQSDEYFSLRELKEGTEKEKENLSKFKASTALNSNKDTLENIIKNIADKLQIYKNLRTDAQNLKQFEKIDSLYNSLEENRITEGIVNFTILAEEESFNINERLRELRDNLTTLSPRDIAIKLRQMNDYVASYETIVDDLITDINLMIPEMTNSKVKKMLKETKESLNNIKDVIVSVENTKNNIQVELVADMLIKYSGNSGISREDLVKGLKSGKDITQYEKTINSLAYSSDDGLKMFDVMMKELLREGERKHIDAMTDLRVLASKNNIKDFSELFEKDKDGKVTNYIISKYRLSEVEEIKNKFFEKLNSKYELTGDKLSDLRIKKTWTKAKNRTYKKEISKFFRDNYKNHPDAELIIENKRKDIYDRIVVDTASKDQIKEADNEFQAWYDNNVSSYVRGGQSLISYKNELLVPKDKYINPDFNKIVNSKKYGEFYTELINHKKRVDSYLPISRKTNLYLAPQLYKDSRERFLEAEGIKNKSKQVKESIKDSVVRREDDAEFGGGSITDSSGKLHKFLPIFFTKKIEDPNENMSTDLLGSMSAYIDMAERYKVFSQNIEMINLTKDVYNDRNIVGNKKSLGSALSRVSELFKDDKAIENTGGLAAEHLSKYVDMLMYREIKKNHGSLKLGDVEIDIAKLTDAFNKYTALRGLSLNFHSSMANITLGNALIRQEQIAKEHFSLKDLTFADKVYWKEMGGVLRDVGNIAPKSKLNLFAEYFDSLQEYESNVGNQNANRSKFGRLFTTSALMIGNNLGEHQMQMRTALAIAHSTKVFVDGVETNLWDAYEAKDGKLVPKGNITKTKEGDKFTEADENKYVFKVHRLNQKLHGIYNLKDRALMQRSAGGRLMMMFRKYLVPSLNRRYGKKKYDFLLDSEVEGMYITFKDFSWALIKDLKNGQLNLASNWDNLTPHQRSNMIRTMIEVGYLVAVGLFIAMIGAIDDDDEERLWVLNTLALQVNRLFTELGAYTPLTAPTELMRIMKSPAAGVSSIQPLVKIVTQTFDPWSFLDDERDFISKYSTGTNAGRTKFMVNLERSIPVVKNVQTIINPTDVLKYYSR